MRPSGREPPRQNPAALATAPRMQRGDPRDVAPDAREAGHERLDVTPRHVVWAVAALVAFAVVAAGTVWAFVSFYESRRDPVRGGTLATVPFEPPAPRLEADPVAAGRALAARNAADLTVYEWVDERRRIARVPIEEAMRLLAARGWPDPFEPPAQGAPAAAFLDHRAIPRPGGTGTPDEDPAGEPEP